MKKNLFVIAGLLVASLWVSSVFAQSKMIVVAPGFDHPLSLVAQRVLLEIYKKAGVDVKFETFPPKRASAMFNLGKVDGFIFSDALFIKTHPGGILIYPPIGFDDIVAFTKKNDITINGWDSLKPYSIGYMYHMVVVEDHVKELNSRGVQNPIQAFKKLDAGRSDTDIVVMPRIVGLKMIKILKLEGIKVLEPAIERVPLYHVVSAQNADLAPALGAALAEMVKSGKLKTITDNVEAEILK
ncbi:MAG: transporter substrate-binding domain-containing protein [Proteobacteria bacterium]|nr:transporter substrate-binding domain-containing protein [Pseudomonadota bacterium]